MLNDFAEGIQAYFNLIIGLENTLLGVVSLGLFSCTEHMEKLHPNLIKIGKKIRALRKARNYSQEDFATDAQLGRSYMGRVERGEQNISMQSLIQIALTLKVEVGELFPPLRELKAPYRKS